MIRTKKECSKCTIEISISNYNRHYNSCGTKKPSSGLIVKEQWKLANGKYQCPHCQKEYKREGICSHIWRMHTDEGNQFDPNISFKNGTIIRVAWNKGLTKETDGRIKKQGGALSEKYKNEIHPSKGRIHTEETKDKLSKIRIKYLKENPDKHPYKLYHYSKGPSYAEKYFGEVFDNENMQLQSYYRVGIYELDFAHPDKMIAIEIDGEQHYYDKRITESDKRKDTFLEGKGWTVYRIRWAHWQKKTYEEKRVIVKEIRGSIA